jgi:4-amino-4-deoxy-L-arabinose transferase-like glycosyltransferase
MARRLDGLLLGLFAAAAVLLLANLSNGLLWQDEAETAMLARRILQHGYPRAFDGRNYIELPAPYGHGPAEAWIYNAWAPLYVVAGVFAILGESTWSARLPFALFGLWSVYLAWRLAEALTADRRIQRLTVALLAASVPFLLHMRQCRYYAMTTALLLAVCLAYLRFLREPSARRAALAGAALAALFYTNFGTFVPAVGALTLHQLVWGRPAGRRRLALAGLAVFLLSLPWLFLCRAGAFVGPLSLERIGDHLEYYLRVTNKYLAPLAAIAASLVLFRWRPIRRMPPEPPRQAWTFLVLMALLQFAFLLIPEQRHMRYLIPTLPLLLIGVAWWLAACLAWSRPGGWIVAGLALFTNLLQSTHPAVPLARFAGELTHRYVGPMEGVVGYLRRHGRPEHVVKIPYDDRTLMFYTDVVVERPSRFTEESYPDWIVIRRDWIPAAFFEGAYFRRIEATYDRVELDAPDVLWQNREDPGSHHFRTVVDAPRVVIYRRREAQHG